MSKKRSVFMLLKIVSFSNDIVSPINLNIATIINDHLSIESALKFTVIFFFSLGAYVVPGDIQKRFAFARFASLSRVTDCEVTRAASRLTLKRYVRACKK